MKHVVFLILLISFNNDIQAQNFDIDLLRKINIERNANFDSPYLFVTNSSTAISFSAPAIMFTVGLIKKDSVLKQNSVMIIGALAVSTLISLPMKFGFNRERPFTTYPDIIKLTKGGSPSFPSGHTSAAFSTATAMSIAYPKWYIITPSFLWASAVGYSRMHLGVHYPSDVFVGAIVGAGSAWISQFLTKKIQHKRSNKRLQL